MFVVGFFSSNMMLVFIAVVLYLAGGQELKFTQLRRVFAGVRVCEVMAPKPVPVDSKTGLLSFMKDHENLLRRYHVVSDGGRVVGVFDILSVGSVGSGSFDALTVGDLASSDYGVVSAESDVGLELKTLLGRPFVLVVLENKVVGCVTPEVLVSRVPVFAVSKGLAF
jgi:predicted transcriptional regulator